ncbi:hypothetical protein PBRA_006938 [Plasmodiophora brassicae]|uniref:Uncharacterized protein n=1 Tax=Plasmodiophora brassicae TaxID=37360 RepID=A0A0G4IUL6_PLABS|nr:hypothetical protein PBRA_006938 [Plasmodiophora brassicae]
MMKYLIASRLDYQMDNDAAFSSKWLGGKFTAPERRILITKWVGEAWEQFWQAGYIRKYFEKTGCRDGLSQPSRLSSTSTMKHIPKAATAVLTANSLKATTISRTPVRQTRKRLFSRYNRPVFVKVTVSRSSTVMANRSLSALLLHHVRLYTGSLCPTPTSWSVVIEQLHTTSSLGQDPFEEPIGVGGYHAVPVNRAYLCDK